MVLSLPEDWNYTINGLCAISIENKTSISNTLKELKERKYLVVNKLNPSQTPSGKFEYVYNFYEKPLENLDVDILGIEKQGIENLGLENLDIENLCLYKSTKELNTKELNTKELKEKNNKKEKDLESFDSSINSFSTNEEVRELLKDFVVSRKLLKKPLTTRALKIILADLGKHSESEQIEALSNCIASGWLKPYFKGTKNNGATINQELDERIAKGAIRL